jgi:hypothetical protein
LISKISISCTILEGIFRAKEIIDSEYQEANDWITDILENEHRVKKSECEICNSNKKLEVHHIRGRSHGNEVMTVCLECHRILTNRQRLWNYQNSEILLEMGIIDICELKHEKTGIGIYKLIAESLTSRYPVIL